jgi:hypothetical protein
MEPKFKPEDIGKLVELELDPNLDPIARALGASAHIVYGKIVDLAEDYVKIEVRPPRGVIGISHRRKLKEVRYDSIVDYIMQETVNIKDPIDKI